MDFNNQLNRMKDLMTYGKVNEGTVKPISTHTLEYKAVAADGNTYGIIKECSKFYIKMAEKGKENLAEAYQYLGGFNNKKNYEYNSYANALKQLDLKLSSINEARKGYASINTEDVSDFTVNHKEMDALTESMRSEIARQRQLMYNTAMLCNESCQIGKTPFTTQPEAEHANSGDKNAPYTDAAKAEPEFGGSKENSPKEAGTPYANGNAKKKAEKGKDVKVDGSVASQKPSGAKAVKMNEGIDDFSDDDIEDLKNDVTDIDTDVNNLDTDLENGMFDNGTDEDIIDIEGGDDKDVTPSDDDEFFDSIINGDDEEDGIKNDDEDGDDGKKHKSDDDDDEVKDSDDNVEDDGDKKYKSDDDGMKDSEEDAIDGDKEGKKEDDDEVQSDEDKKEILLSDGEEDEIEECGYPEFENLSESKKHLMNKLTNMIVNEVMSNFGNHPGFRKQPMTMPAGGENKPFATSKGDSKPYSNCYKSGDANICRNKDIVDDKMRKKIMKCLKTDEVRDKFASKICEAVMNNLKTLK